MKEYEKKAADTVEPDTPQGVGPMKSRRSGSGGGSHELPCRESAPEALPQAHTGLLDGEHLSHPANAAPLADFLGQLQHDYGNAYVQRVVSEARETPAAAGQKEESGQSLDSSTRAEMETAFQENFGEVRIHTDSEAAKAAEQVGAQAFTRGKDIYFDQGVYEPATQGGKAVIAHELAHVVQQGEASSGHRELTLGPSGDTFEQEAEQAASRVLAGQRVNVTGRNSAPAIQRQGRVSWPTMPPPTITQHDRDITWTPPFTPIDAAGQFSISYFYNIGANIVVLTLGVPAQVAVLARPLYQIMETEDFELIDSGPEGSRAVLVRALRTATPPLRIQVTFTRNSFIYIVNFLIPTSDRAQQPAPPPQQQPPPPAGSTPRR
jgi:Domain of unknown function (DUF4157)